MEARKQYIVVVDDVGMALLANIAKVFTFIEVQGMPMVDNAAYQFLVNPVQKVEGEREDREISEVADSAN